MARILQRRGYGAPELGDLNLGEIGIQLDTGSIWVKHTDGDASQPEILSEIGKTAKEIEDGSGGVIPGSDIVTKSRTETISGAKTFNATITCANITSSGTVAAAGVTVSGNNVWHTGNDGKGSGLVPDVATTDRIGGLTVRLSGTTLYLRNDGNPA